MRRAGLVFACALVFTSTACASVWRQYDVAPNGLPRGEARLRDWLAQGRADSAFALLTRGQVGPGDDLLRSLFLGAAAYYSGDYKRSAGWLEYARYLAEERATKSLSRGAISLVSNDLILAYEPSRTERLFIPYYAALGRLRSGDKQGAAVEARRLSALLERYDAQDLSGDEGLRATLRYFAATVFEAAGEGNDALVAYRNAALLAPGLVTQADTPNGGSHHTTNGDATHEASGDLVVFIERGYVAHRAGESLHVLFGPGELYAFSHADVERRATVASLLAARVLEGRQFTPAEQARYCNALGSCLNSNEQQSQSDDSEDDSEDDDDHEPYLLKIAWPVMRRTFEPHALALQPEQDSLPVHDLADVSSAVIADFESEKPMILARTIARAALKAALAKGAEKKAKEKDETAGRVLGVLANAGGFLLEQADTRSWHLLPSRLSIVRLHLPAGAQPVTLNLGGTSVDLGTIDIPARGIAVLSARVW